MGTDNRRVKANIFLLITAAIWGFGFVAQRFGAMLIAPFTFNALRFGIGALSLIPLLMYKKKIDKFEGKGAHRLREVCEYRQTGSGQTTDRKSVV